MNPFDDDESVRARSDEELLRGTAVGADPALTALVAMLRESAEAPGPRPTDALATMLRTGRAPRAVTSRAPIPVAASTDVPLATRVRRLASRAAALGLAAKIALTAGVAVASVGTAAAIGGVPAAVQERATETLGHIVAVFTSGSHADPDDGSPATQSPNGAAAGPGASNGPTQHPSPTDVPTSGQSEGNSSDPAGSNGDASARRAGSPASGDAADTGSSSAARDAPPTDHATVSTGGASDSSTGRPDPASPTAAGPAPTEPTHSGNPD